MDDVDKDHYEHYNCDECCDGNVGVDETSSMTRMRIIVISRMMRMMRAKRATRPSRKKTTTILPRMMRVKRKAVRSERCSLHAVALLDPIWIDKWHQLFPAHWKVGPASVFGASQPLEPAECLALLILKAGDVESNPGPQNRKLPPSALTTQTTTLNSTTHSHATTSHHNKKTLTTSTAKYQQHHKQT